VGRCGLPFGAVSDDKRSDFELLDCWGNGDLAAGSSLFERHFDTLYRFFRTKVDNELQDLMQRTLLACVEARDRFRRESSFRTYLFQTARFQLYSHYRELRRSKHLDFAVITAADLHTSPSGVVARKQDFRLLLEALRRIPVDHQIVLELSFWEELSGPEIAEVLGIPEPTVRSRLRRAGERLRGELEGLGGSALQLRETADDLHGWARRLGDLARHDITLNHGET
jgi:RNA polymerase sigma factor (sigma-70 family)